MCSCVCVVTCISVFVCVGAPRFLVYIPFFPKPILFPKLIPWTRAGITGDSQICISLQRPRTQSVDQERYSAHVNETFLGTEPVDLDIFSQTHKNKDIPTAAHSAQIRLCILHDGLTLFYLSFFPPWRRIHRARIQAHAMEQFKCSNIYTRSK